MNDKKISTRRDFLKGTTAAAAGMALAGGLNVARTVHAAGSDAIKIGLIGCGGRGSGAAVNAMNAGKDVRLVAMADVFADHFEDSRQRLKKMYPEQVAVDDDHCFVGFDAYKKLIHSGVDVVLIACTSHFHPVMLKAAIDAGKHVFCEKPHGIDVPGVKMSMAAAEEAKKKNLCLVSGLCWRYDLGVREAIKRIQDGAIGEIIAIEKTYLRGPYMLRERQPGWNEMQYQFQNWYHFNWLSGDDTSQSLIHNIDDGVVVAGRRPAAKGLGHGRTPGLRRAQVRRRVRPSGHGLRVCQRRAHLRLLPQHPRLLQRQHQRDPRHQRPRLHARRPADRRRETWHFKGPRPSMYDVEHP